MSTRDRETAEAFLQHIISFITERRISYREYDAAIMALDEATEVGELALLLDVFFESAVERASSARSGASTSAIEGPYFVPGAPLLERPYVMPQRPDEPGDRLVFSGTVSAPDGEPLRDVEIDLWHADATEPGTYSNFHLGQPDFNLRGRMRTDTEGRFSVRTIRPAPYPIPSYGPTGRILAFLGRSTWRPAHLHFKFNRAGYHELITQLYFQGDDRLESDCAGAVKDDLLIDVTETGPPDGDGRRTLAASHQFTLEPVT